ncbi:fibronectin type III domain-containing protein [Aeromicrobium sp.]|uniref:fibronectin type III domain-containing protein n=1 Tax=Aeromicrobium sp. TaxID=1871063 RepID=UPI003D6C1D76
MRQLMRSLAVATAAVVFLTVGPAAADLPSPRPTGLAQSSSSSTAVSLTWNPVSNAPRYQVKISPDASMSGASYQGSSDTVETMNGLQPGRGYYVKVRVITTSGTPRSEYSEVKRAWTTFAVPSGFKATKRDGATATFDWADVPNAPRYRIKLADNPSMTGSTYHRFDESGGTVDGLTAGTTYYAKVRVITPDDATLSGDSPAVTIPPSVVEDEEEEPGGSEPLTVASFNVRCANCYKGQNLERPWADRRGVVVASILKQKPDVIGIQEASQGWLESGGSKINLSQFEDLRNRLRSGGTPYEVTNPHRNNCVNSTTPNSCRYQDRGASKGTKIFFNSATVKLVSQGSKKLPQCSGCNERYVAWAILEQKSTGQEFFFAETHIEYGSSYYSLRKAQTEAMMAEVERRRPSRMPAFVVGDLNSTRYFNPTNAPYDEIVSHGFVDPLGHTYKSARISPAATAEKRIRAHYNSHNNFIRTVPHFSTNENGSNLDYIFTTPMRTLVWETVLNLDSSGKLAGTIPSDHNMIVAEVLLP